MSEELQIPGNFIDRITLYVKSGDSKMLAAISVVFGSYAGVIYIINATYQQVSADTFNGAAKALGVSAGAGTLAVATSLNDCRKAIKKRCDKVAEYFKRQRNVDIVNDALDREITPGVSPVADREFEVEEPTNFEEGETWREWFQRHLNKILEQ